MKGRRLVALLCVLLVHAAVVFQLMRVKPWSPVPVLWDPQPITLVDEPAAPQAGAPIVPGVAARIEAPIPLDAPTGLPADAMSTSPDTSHVDWPLEGRKAVARVLASEAEAERIAKMFAGPGGTWASLTRRQRSKLNKFRFRPGVGGLEYDSQGNLILHISDGCVIVNSMFFACTIGKPKVRDDMFDNMREYFDEQRLPATPEGNGTEPEARRPAG
jgi:hypothetical protein